MNDPIDLAATCEERSKPFSHTFWTKNFAHWHIVVFTLFVKKEKCSFKIFCLDEMDEVAYKLIWRHLVILADDDSAQRITRCVAYGRECQWGQQR